MLRNSALPPSRVRIPERRPASARWSRRLAVFAVPVLVLTILLHRFAELDTSTALVLLGIGIALAVFALVAGIVALITIWNRGGRGTRHALVGIVIALAVLAWPTWKLSSLATLPPINDVTTDWRNPPALEAAASERAPASNPLVHPGLSFIERQAAAYPEITPSFLDYPAPAVYAAARQLVAERGWRELAAIPPRDGQAGTIQAVARTLVLGFRDDVAIRITPRGISEARVDMRSASRIGRHDMGENAERIYQFLKDLTVLLEAPQEPQPGEAPEA